MLYSLFWLNIDYLYHRYAKEKESQASAVREGRAGTAQSEKGVPGSGERLPKKLDALVMKRGAAHPKAKKQKQSRR